MTVDKDVLDNNRRRLDYIRQKAAEGFDRAERDRMNGTVEVRVSFLGGRAGKVFVTVTECQPE